MAGEIVKVGDLIGLPFIKGGRDPAKGLDCYGVVKECHRRMGIDVPDFRTPEYFQQMENVVEAHKVDWNCHWARQGREQCPPSVCKPGRVLQLVILGGFACHVGFVFKPGWFVHAWEDCSGVTAERITGWQKRIVGVYEFGGEK